MQTANLAAAILGLARRAAEAEPAVSFAFGKVVQEYPLQVMLEQRLLLHEEQLILTENVIGAAALRTDKEIYIREKIYDVFHNLEAGDRVLLAAVQGGQAYVILSRYYATELADELAAVGEDLKRGEQEGNGAGRTVDELAGGLG